MAEGNNESIQLLAQRLEAQEKLNSQQSRELKELRTIIDKRTGAEDNKDKNSDRVIKLLPVVFGGIVLSGIGFLWNSIDSLNNEVIEFERQSTERMTKLETSSEYFSEHATREGHPDKMIARLDVLEDNLSQIQSKKYASASAFDDHIHKDSHSQAAVTIENINTRLADIEAEMAADDGIVQRLNARLVGVESRVETLGTVTDEHEQEIDDAEDKINMQQSGLAQLIASEAAVVTRVSELERDYDELETEVGSNMRSLSAIKASTQANFVEIESQLRGLNAVANVQLQQVWQQMQVVYAKVFAADLPDLEYYSTDIPAKASTQVGQVQSNGH